MWEDAPGYEAYVGRWSRGVGRLFTNWLNVAGALTWLDVACGTGALTEAIRSDSPAARIFGIDSSPAYLSYLRERLGPSAVPVAVSRAERLPFAPATFDVTVSGLILNFLEPAPALEEQRRVTRPGGCIAAYVWDYAGDYELVRRFWDAASVVDPDSRRHDPGRKFPICRPEALRDAFAAAGLTDIATTALDAVAEFPAFDDYWRALDVRQGSLAAYLSAISPERRALIRTQLAHSMPVAADGTLSLRLRAFAVRGRN